MQITDNFTKLEQKIENIFFTINSNSNVKLVRASEGPGLYVIFGKPGIRSSIRIYQTNQDNIYSYAIGNSQRSIDQTELLKIFPSDLKNVLFLFERNISTAPINELPDFKKKRQEEYFLKNIQTENQNILNENDNKIISLSDDDFILQLREITSDAIRNKEKEQRIKLEKKENQLSLLMHSFINRISRNYRNDSLLAAKKGKNNINYSMSKTITSNYVLMRYSNEEINKIIENESISERLSKTFKGFNYSINIVSQSYKPFDIMLNLKW